MGATLPESIETYESMLEMLETVHWGEWIVFYDGELMKVGESLQEMADFAVMNYG